MMHITKAFVKLFLHGQHSLEWCLCVYAHSFVWLTAILYNLLMFMTKSVLFKKRLEQSM